MNSTISHSGDFYCGASHQQANGDALTRDEQAEIAALAPRPPHGMVILKFGSRSVVGSYLLGSGRQVVLKYYFPKGWVKRLSYGLRTSRCRLSWDAGLRMRMAGLPTPEPLAIAEWIAGPLWNRGFLATERADGVTLLEWVNARSGDPDALQEMARSLRRIFDRMASERIAHGDLKATNWIVDAENRPVMIDLDAVSFSKHGAGWEKLRLRDRRIFESNWKDSAPEVACVFQGLFDAADP